MMWPPSPFGPLKESLGKPLLKYRIGTSGSSDDHIEINSYKMNTETKNQYRAALVVQKTIHEAELKRIYLAIKEIDEK